METESRRRNMETSSNGLRFCEYDSIPLLLNAKDIMHLLGLSMKEFVDPFTGEPVIKG